MAERTPYSLELIRAVTMREVSYLIKSKRYMRVHSFDELALVLFVAAHSYNSKGVTEREISSQLCMPRSTVNRLIKRLLDGGQIVHVDDTAPREFVFNVNFTTIAYGADALKERAEFYKFVISTFAETTSDIVKILAESQFDNNGR